MATIGEHCAVPPGMVKRIQRRAKKCSLIPSAPGDFPPQKPPESPIAPVAILMTFYLTDNQLYTTSENAQKIPRFLGKKTLSNHPFSKMFFPNFFPLNAR
jgi:hypothetical protein